MRASQPPVAGLDNERTLRVCARREYGSFSCEIYSLFSDNCVAIGQTLRGAAWPEREWRTLGPGLREDHQLLTGDDFELRIGPATSSLRQALLVVPAILQ